MNDLIVAFTASEKSDGWWSGNRQHGDIVRHSHGVRELAKTVPAAEVEEAAAKLETRLERGWAALDEVAGDVSTFQRYYAEWLKCLRLYEAHIDVAQHQRMRAEYRLDRWIQPDAPEAEPTRQLALV